MYESVKKKGESYLESPFEETSHSYYLKYLKEPILEIGCGNGDLLSFLKMNNFDSLMGVDINKDLVKHCKERNLDVKECDMLNLKFTDSKFNSVLCHHVFEHLPIDQQVPAINEIKRVLKENGLFIISVPSWKSSDAWDDYSHVHPYTSKSIKGLLEDTGFEIIEFIYVPYGTFMARRFNLDKILIRLAQKIKLYHFSYLVICKKKY